MCTKHASAALEQGPSHTGDAPELDTRAKSRESARPLLHPSDTSGGAKRRRAVTDLGVGPYTAGPVGLRDARPPDSRGGRAVRLVRAASSEALRLDAVQSRWWTGRAKQVGLDAGWHPANLSESRAEPWNFTRPMFQSVRARTPRSAGTPPPPRLCAAIKHHQLRRVSGASLHVSRARGNPLASLPSAWPSRSCPP